MYSDVTDYNVTLEGKASVGVIAVLDLRGAEEVLSEIPEGDERVILKNNVDTYIGKEVG